MGIEQGKLPVSSTVVGWTFFSQLLTHPVNMDLLIPGSFAPGYMTNSGRVGSSMATKP